MLYECVVSPNLLLEFAKDRRNYKNFIKKFTLGGSLVYCDYPQIKKMKRKILGSQSSDVNDLEKTRLIELIEAIDDFHKSRRLNSYNGELDWASNIIKENNFFEFGHIISDNTTNTHNYINCDDFLDIDYPLQKRINKTCLDMNSTVSSLLRLSSEIILIDPYFKGSDRWINVLKTFINSAFNKNFHDHISVVIIYDGGKQSAATAANIKYSIQRANITLPKEKKLTIVIKSISEKNGCYALHNRFILTDLGGFCFPFGLDENDATDDIFILNNESHKTNWEQYSKLDYYNILEKIEIHY